jgi:hypothetical protein
MLNNNIQSEIKKEILDTKGYYLNLRLDKNELDLIYNIIKKSVLRSVKKYSPDYYKIIKNINLKDYHKFSKKLDQANICNKKNRSFKSHEVSMIKNLKFFKNLTKIFDTSKLGTSVNQNEEIDYRVVRPNQNSDIGSMHADEWFWKLNNFKSEKKSYERVKCWVPIIIEKGKNGLRYIPKSHKMNIKYSSFKDNSIGILKPKKILNEKKYRKVLFKTEPGQMVLFNDKLVHGGKLGGKTCRVSFEFTILIKKSKLKKYKIDLN